MLQIAVAMKYLHESGVMYCDLKATNVLVNVLEDHDGYLVICASCTLRHQWKFKLHDSGYNHAIRGYNPVRHLKMRSTEKDTKSVCVYSFASIFFEALTGKVPFKDIPLRNILQSICDRVRLGFIRCGLLS